MVQVHPAPADLVIRIAGVFLDQYFEDLVGVLVSASFPQRFRLLQGLGGEDQRKRQRNRAETEDLFHWGYLT